MRSRILYEDNDIIVCHKPAGMPVQSAKGTVMDMESELKSYLKKNTGSAYLGIVHRLDQPVEGIILFARNQKAAAFLSKRIGVGEDGPGMNKIYEARIFGHMTSDEGSLESVLGFDKKDNRAYVCSEEDGGKKAFLEYKRISSDSLTDTLMIRLHTGRHHQIRMQMLENDTPLLGDNKYYTKESQEYSAEKRIKNVCLRAVSLEFKHPSSGKNMKFELDML